jgi:hypothetical protein
MIGKDRTTLLSSPSGLASQQGNGTHRVVKVILCGPALQIPDPEKRIQAADEMLDHFRQLDALAKVACLSDGRISKHEPAPSRSSAVREGSCATKSVIGEFGTGSP